MSSPAVLIESQTYRHDAAVETRLDNNILCVGFESLSGSGVNSGGALPVWRLANVTSGYLECTRGPRTEDGYATWQVAIIATICAFIIVGTIIGNVLVCMAVAIVRKLRTPSNLLIVSLAVSDLLVAILVMPPATAYEVMNRWPLGRAVCDAWTSLDVMLCTASILNLCTISVDRYLVITRPLQYAIKRTPTRMALMVTAVWTLSAVISIPPLFGWTKDSAEGQCALSQEIGYQIYATVGAFYIPLTIMIVIYYRIYMVSSRIADAEARSKPIVAHAAGGASRGQNPHGRTTSADSSTPLNPKKGSDGIVRIDEERENLRNFIYNQQTNAKNPDDIALGLLLNAHRKRFRFLRKSRLNRIACSKDRKATKTLGVIMGAFTACWLPFFILALIKPFCTQPDLCIPHWLNGLFLWLGYTNSFSNPIIYARFNRDFRTPFKQILSCSCRGINSRMRSESYADQYGVGGAASTAVGENNFRPSLDTVVRYQNHGLTVINVQGHDLSSAEEENNGKLEL